MYILGFQAVIEAAVEIQRGEVRSAGLTETHPALAEGGALLQGSGMVGNAGPPSQQSLYDCMHSGLLWIVIDADCRFVEKRAGVSDTVYMFQFFKEPAQRQLSDCS